VGKSFLPEEAEEVRENFGKEVLGVESFEL
jgi:hypothetical protein